MITTPDTIRYQMLSQSALDDPDIQAGGALYFLEGQYLLRYRDGAALKSKFVTAADVAAAFTKTDLDTGWQPAGIVRQGQKPGGQFFVYSAPSQKIEVMLSDGEKPISLPIPRTVLLGLGSTYYLWALREKYFSADAVVCMAPFPNVYSDGRICWGHNTPPEALVHNARRVWELFFSTPFNQDLATDKSKSEKTDVRKHLRQLAEKKARQYPMDDLLPVNGRTSVNSLVDQILRS